MKLNTTKIKIILAEKGMTQTQLATACGIARQNISVILSRGRCSHITVGKLAAGLGVSVADIIEEER